MYGESVSRKGNGCPLYVTCDVSVFCKTSLVNLLLWVAPEIAHLGRLKARPAQLLNLSILDICLLSCLGVLERRRRSSA